MAQVEQEFAKAFRNVNITLQSLDEVKALFTILDNSAQLWADGVDNPDVKRIEELSQDLWDQLRVLDDVFTIDVDTAYQRKG